MTIQHTLLVVDDTPANLTVLTHLLRDTYRIKVANSGVRALELVNTAPPDLILLDVSMPEMDGYILTKRIKSDPRFAGVPVIMHSSLSGMSNQQLGQSVGVDEYVAKFEPQKLSETLAASAGKTVKLNATVDESLIGGMIVKLGSQMIDSSIKSKLASLQNAMKEVG